VTQTLRIRPALVSAAVAAVALALYSATLAPGVGAGDSGELLLAAQTLGVPHPPGYPLWTLLARVLAMLPWGDVAGRVNALSAIFAALGAGLFHLLARRAGLRPFAALVATALYAASITVWSAATETEVYALAAPCFLLLVLLAWRARSRHTASLRSDALAFFAIGLAPVVHQTLAFPATFLGIWVLERDARPGRVMRGLLWSSIGSTLFLVVALRSGAAGSFTFAHETGVLGAVDGMMRQGYGAIRQHPMSTRLALSELGAMAGSVAASIGAAAALLALLGAWLARRERGTLRLVAVAAATIPVALVLLVGFMPDAEHVAQIAPFLAPVVAAACLMAGAGAEAAARRVPHALRWPTLAATATCALATVIAHQGLSDRHDFELADRYAHDLLAPLPKNATLIVDGDNETFLTAYATRLRGLRPDVTLIHRRGYIFGDVYGLAGMPRSRWTEIAHRADLERLRESKVPVYYTTPPEDLADAGVVFHQEGLVARAFSPLPNWKEPPRRVLPKPWLPPADWPKSATLLGGRPKRYDFVTRKLAVSYSDAAARALWSQGLVAESIPWFEDAARVGYDIAGAHLNLATALATAGVPERALDELLVARAVAPLDPEPAARLAVFLGAAGRHEDAARWFERAYRIDPLPTFAVDAARAWARAGNVERSRYWRERTG